MDTQTINTPEKLHQAIGKFLQSDYSHENLVEIYNDARKCAMRFRGDYSALPALPAHKDNPLDGLQDVMDWCIKSSEVVDDIVFNLERQTISKVINQLKKLRDFASRVLSLVNSKLREQAQKEARAKVENEYKNLNEKASRLKIEEMPLSHQIDIAAELNLKQHELLRRETEDMVQIYLSKDPTFKDRLSQPHKEICEMFGKINKLAGSNTPTGKLLDIYCKLKDIPLQRQFDAVGYAYSPIDDLTDVICSGCNRLYTSIDTVIKTFEEIQTKAEQHTAREQEKVDLLKPIETSGGENGGQTEEQQLAVRIIKDLNEWVSIGASDCELVEHPPDEPNPIPLCRYCEKLPEKYRPNHCLDYRFSIHNKLGINPIILKLESDGKGDLAKRIERLRDELNAEVENDKNLPATSPMHLPNFGLSCRSGRLVKALECALPCLGTQPAKEPGIQADLASGQNKPTTAEYLEGLLKLFEELQSALQSKDQNLQLDCYQRIEKYISPKEQFVDMLRQCQSEYPYHNEHTHNAIEIVASAIRDGSFPYPALWMGLADARFISELKRWIKEASTKQNEKKLSEHKKAGLTKGQHKTRDINKRFSFEQAQAFFDDKDLRLPAGAVGILKNLVKSFGRGVSFQKLDNESSNKEASEYLRRQISTLRGVLKKKKIPCKVNLIKGTGYVLSNS